MTGLKIPTEALECLNSALEADAAAINNLFLAMTFCDREFAEHHPTIQCGDMPNGRCFVRTLGVLNGILSSLGYARIAADFNDDGIIDSFKLYPEDVT